MIKEIKTEKFEGIAVLVPDGGYWPTLKYVKYSDGKEYHMVDYYFGPNHTGGFILWYKDFGGRKKYPEKDGLKVIGISSDIMEEECAEIVKDWIGYYPICYSSKEIFIKKLESLGCYSVNPFPKPDINAEKYTPISDDVKDTLFMNDWDQWENAQEHTGTWLILRKV